MSLPSHEYQALCLSPPHQSLKGLDGFVSSCVGQFKCRKSIVKKNIAESEKIIEDSLLLRNDSDRKLQFKLKEMQTMFRRRGNGFKIDLSKTLPLLAEAANRTIGIRPYPVQIAGVIALFKGYLAEMATGEGKSLTACFRAILAGWTERPCHIITVNDYLAKRDAEEMGALYSFCGLSVGWVAQEMEQNERRVRYQKHVVYVTSKEILADFLRDRLSLGKYHHPSQRVIQHLLTLRKEKEEKLVMRGLDTAIIDEADSVLIDEAVTPLIISKLQENSSLTSACQTASELIKKLIPYDDYQVDRKYREIHLTVQGSEKIAALADPLPNIWQGKRSREELIVQALSAWEFYRVNEQYVVQNGKVVIVDESTGRMMPSRTWQYGLHQAIEAKEGLKLSFPNETDARLSFQNFFRLFNNLCGLTGTASDASKELWTVYRLPVMKIPTNKPCLRIVHSDRVFHNQKQKWETILNEIIHYHAIGRPVLVGTRSVKASQELGDALSCKGLQFNLLNALKHKEEAAIVAAAGKHSAITISTNMAGRGTDIKLAKGIADMGGLHVMLTEKHQSRRIDWQLFGRCARQGDPGSCQAFMCLDDELFQRYTPGLVKKNLLFVLQKKIPFATKVVKQFSQLAQHTAGYWAYRQRKNLSKMDAWLEQALAFGNSDVKTN